MISADRSSEIKNWVSQFYYTSPFWNHFNDKQINIKFKWTKCIIAGHKGMLIALIKNITRNCWYGYWRVRQSECTALGRTSGSVFCTNNFRTSRTVGSVTFSCFLYTNKTMMKHLPILYVLNNLMGGKYVYYGYCFIYAGLVNNMELNVYYIIFIWII